MKDTSRPETMTPVRACQVASDLLKRNADHGDTFHHVLGDPLNPGSHAAAIEVLRRIAASVITHGSPSKARSPRA